MTGILNGVAIGNSLGLSPQSGLPHNNRVGDLDPFALPFMMRTAGLSLEEAERVLCKESGLKALSGGFNDIRDIERAGRARQRRRAQLALDVFVHNIRHWIGAYYSGIERGGRAGLYRRHRRKPRRTLRAAICRNLDQLGIMIDARLERQMQGAGGGHQRAGIARQSHGHSHQ